MVAGLRPDLYLLVAFIALIVVEVLGFLVGRRIGGQHFEETTPALTTALAAIFSIVALVLSFSFNFSLNRFEQRRDLVVREANAIGTAYLRSSVLQPREDQQYRDLLREYIADRIDYYVHDGDPGVQQRDETQSATLQAGLWTIVSQAVRADRRDVGASLLMQVTNDVIDISGEQRAELAFRFGGHALTFILFVTAAGALALGLAFGYGNLRNLFIALLFVLILTWLSFSIIDLQTPQTGFARVNLSPLYLQQQSMAIPVQDPRP